MNHRAVGRRRFVGRRRELSVLCEVVDRAAAGDGQLVLVAGEPGIGKTRLVEEAVEYGRTEGAVIAWGRCWDGGGAPAFWPWIQVLRPLVQRLPGKGTAHLAGEIGRLVPEFGALPEPVDVPEHERFRLFDAIAGLLGRVADDHPLVVVLDDLHWADAPSLLLLRFVARELRRRPVAVIGTYRDVELAPEHLLLDTAAEECRHFSLAGLGPSEVADLVLALTEETLSAGAEASLHRATNGNPFFVRELVHLGVAGNRNATVAPETVQAAIRRRVGALSPACSRLLAAAAVLGQECESTVLTIVSEQPEEAVTRLVSEAVSARLLETTAAGIRFGHALVRETLYTELSSRQRTELHARAADAIEQRYQDHLESQLGELAHHLWQSGREPERATEYAVRAGRRALGGFAYEDAVLHLSRATRILDGRASTEVDRRCEVLSLLGRAQTLAADLPAARETYERVAALAERAGAGEYIADAALAVGVDYEFGVRDELEIRLLESALEHVPERRAALRARLLARLARALLFTPESVRRAQLSEEAVTLARRSCDTAALAATLFDRHLAVWNFADPPERLGIADEIIELAHHRADRALVVRGHVLRLANLLELADARVRRRGRPLRPARAGPPPAAAGLARALPAGHPALRRRPVPQGGTTRRRGHGQGTASGTTIRGRVGQCAARRGEALARARGGGHRRVASDSRNRHRGARRARRCRRVAGRLRGAGRSTGRVRTSGCRRLQPPAARPDVVIALASLAAACHVLEDDVRAPVLYELLLPHEPYLMRMNQGGVGCSGPVSYHLGLLALTMKRYDVAEEHLLAAVALSERMGAPVFAANARVKLAECLTARGKAEDRERAEAVRRHAEEIFTALAVRPILCRAVATPGTSLTAVAGLHRTGEYWTLTCAGRTVQLRDSIGLRHLARLVSAPGQEIHVLDLTGDATGRTKPVDGCLGPMLDDHARTAYRARLAELAEDLDEAEQFGDSARAEAARHEIDALTEQLTAAYGLGGRPRQPGAAAERARTAVTKAIKAAIARIARHHPALGDHLSHAVRTGTFCVYSPYPAASVTWRL
jgi:tetratricopeptide (TPR) repeat protein